MDPGEGVQAQLITKTPWAVMSVACGASLVTMVAPLLYARMVADDQLLPSQIGSVATCEMLSLAFSSTLASARLGTGRLGLKVAVAVCVFALANLLTAFSTYPSILVVRATAGLAEGMFIWAQMQIFARMMRPGKMQGIYLALQGSLGFLVASLYSTVIIPKFGAMGGLSGLAAGSLFLLYAASRLPKSLAPLPRSAGTGRGPMPRAILLLSALFFTMGGILAIWVYLPLLAAQQKQPAAAVGLAVTVALVFQVVGGLAAASIDARIQPRAVVLTGWAMFIGIALGWLAGPSVVGFGVLAAAFGFTWMFCVPYTLGYMVDLDPTRRSFGFITLVNPLGAGLGPWLASMAVRGTDVSGAFRVGIGLLGCALLLVLAETVHHGLQLRRTAHITYYRLGKGSRCNG